VIKSRLGDRALASSVTVCLALVVFAMLVGTADVEESTKISISAGAGFPSGHVSTDLRSPGIHSVLGVPIYSTLVATGDRLPFQASWAQSLTWPLRFITSWEHLFLLRSLFFAVPAIWLCMRMMLSWIPTLSSPRLMAFGLLISSSFGLYVHHNEWSDTYTQTMGIVGVCFF
jgi:hypothetical protein